jgi:hypothetical protein
MDSNFQYRAKNGRLGYHFRSYAASGWGRSNGDVFPVSKPLLSAKSRAMTESGAARTGDSQGRNLVMKPRGDPGYSRPRALSIILDCRTSRSMATIIFMR